MTETATPFYHTSGTLRPDAPSYVARQADTELFESLQRSEFCYVLHARQMGKSSLMNRTAAHLREAGVAVAILDLTAIGQNLTVEQWYDGLLGRLGRSLDLEEELETYWLAHERQSPLQRWMGALHEVVLPHCPGRLVIFIDEIDTVRSLPFSTDEFFAAIRECYNRRSEEPEFTRLTFCLLGVASPSDLIQDTRTTPFNIGHRIELSDFTAAEAAPLALGLIGEDEHGDTETRRGTERERARLLLKRALYWTGGHPYLTQRLCQAIAAEVSARPNPQLVDRLCEELFLSPRAREQDNNLLFVRERLLRSELDPASVLDLYSRVQSGRRVPDDPTNQLVGHLRLSGVARVEAGVLKVRNRIYERAFDQEWIRLQMPDAELRRQRAAYRRGLARAAMVAAVMLTLVGGLAATAVQQARRANRTAHLELQQRRLADERARTSRRERYAAQMNLVEQALAAANLPRAMELLSMQRPEPGREDLRGFEWRYFWRLARQDDSLATLPANDGEVTSIAFSPDGMLLATTGGSDRVKLWDVASRRPAGHLKVRPGQVGCVAFSPDGRLIATGGSRQVNGQPRGELELWDAGTRRRVAALPAPAERVHELVFSPDGRLLAAKIGPNHDARAVTLWHVPTRRELVALKPYSYFCSSVAFSPDGRTLATTGDGADVRFWRVGAWQQLAGLKGHTGAVRAAVYSPDGRTLAAGSAFDGTVKLWDLPQQRVVATLVTPGNMVIPSFSPDGLTLTTVTGRHTIQLWSMETREEVAALRGHTEGVWQAVFSPDGRTLATGGHDRTVKLWQVPPRGQDLFRSHPSKVQALKVSSDGKTLVTAGVDHAIKLWDMATKERTSTLTGHRSMVYYVDISPDGKTVASASDDGTARLWDVATRRTVLSVPLRTNGSNHQGAFSRDGKIWFLGEENGTINLWDVATKRKVGSLKGHKEFIGGMFVSPDGKTLSSTSHDLTLRLWDIASRREVASFRGFRIWLGGGAFSPDGRWVAAVAGDSTVHIWDVQQRRQVARLKVHMSQISWLGFSPDGKTLATSSTDQTTKLWSTASWMEAGTIRDPRQSSWALAFTPDGNTLVMGREDGMVRFWRADSLAEAETQANAEEAKTLRVLSSGGDRHVKLQWQPLTRAVGYNLYRRSESAGSWDRLNRQRLSQTTFTDQDAGLVNGQWYSYAVAPLFPAEAGRTMEGPRSTTRAAPLPLPAGWTGASINEGSRRGTVLFQAGGDRLTIRGSGSGEEIWLFRDQGYFLNRSVTGDPQAEVRMLTRPSAAHEWARAGLMLRDSLAPDARYVFLYTTPARGLFLNWRLEPDSYTYGVKPPIIPPARLKLPITLRLTRRGNVIQAEYSHDDGKTFQPAGDPISFDPPLPPTLHAGLAITSHDPGKISEAKFEGLQIRPLKP